MERFVSRTDKTARSHCATVRLSPDITQGGHGMTIVAFFFYTARISQVSAIGANSSIKDDPAQQLRNTSVSTQGFR